MENKTFPKIFPWSCPRKGDNVLCKHTVLSSCLMKILLGSLLLGGTSVDVISRSDFLGGGGGGGKK